MSLRADYYLLFSLFPRHNFLYNALLDVFSMLTIDYLTTDVRSRTLDTYLCGFREIQIYCELDFENLFG